MKLIDFGSILENRRRTLIVFRSMISRFLRYLSCNFIIIYLLSIICRTKKVEVNVATIFPLQEPKKNAVENLKFEKLVPLAPSS